VAELAARQGVGGWRDRPCGAASLELNSAGGNSQTGCSGFPIACSSMTGTVLSRAVGLGQKRLLQLARLAPQFTPAFAEAPRRLLGNSLGLAQSGEPGSEAEPEWGLRRAATSQPQRPLGEGPEWAERCRSNGLERIEVRRLKPELVAEILAVLEW